MTKRFILFLGMAVLACTAGAEPLIDGDSKAGQKKAAVCAACHGATGNSASAQFPKLAGQGAPYIYQQLKLFKSGKRDNAIMQAQAAGLSEQDMKDLAAYYAAQQIKPGVVAKPELAQAGAVIYHGGKPEAGVPACSGCHGPSGQGNPAARYPRISGQHAQYIAQELTAYRTGERGGYPRAEVMQGVTRGLTNADIKALAAYITGLMPAEPGSLNTSGALMQDLPESATAATPPEAGGAPPKAAAGEDGAPAKGKQPGTQPENDEAKAGAGSPNAAEQGAAATGNGAQSDAPPADGGQPSGAKASEDGAPAQETPPEAQPDTGDSPAAAGGSSEAGAAESSAASGNGAQAGAPPAEASASQDNSAN